MLAGACALSPEMELAAPASPCPGEAIAASASTPDTTVLRWYRAAEERDVRLASSWCATVGDPVVRSAPSGSFPGWERGTGLDVATWNMQINGGDAFRFLHDEFGLDCSAERPRLEAGRPPFVALLQETWRRSDDLPFASSGRNVPWTIDQEPGRDEEPDIVEVAERCGLSLVYVPSARNGPDTGSRPGEDKGNAIVSTLPLSVPLGIDLPLEGGRKVAVAATVHAPGGERVRVVSVHLDVASTLIRALTSGNQTRTRQAKGLIDAIDKAERDGPPTSVVLVGGDMNAWAGNETALKTMWEAFPDSPRWDGLGTRGAFPPDHMFFRRSGNRAFTVEQYRRIDDPYDSDHNGRRLRLRYAPTG
jgi:endonuclease/exonuclease/phosphatase family metal-dependent hydrolase